MLSPLIPPSPVDYANLMENPRFQLPTQQPIVSAYAAGKLEFERMIYQLIQDARERAPAVIARLADEAEERATLAREEAEMAANETATAPTFDDYTRDGKPVAEAQKTSTQQPVTATVTTETITEQSDTLAEQSSSSSNNEDQPSFEDDSNWGGGSDDDEVREFD